MRGVTKDTKKHKGHKAYTDLFSLCPSCNRCALCDRYFFERGWHGFSPPANKNPPGRPGGSRKLFQLLLFSFCYYECDRLLTISFYIATILQCRLPPRHFFQNPECFVFHTIANSCQCFQVTYITLFVNNELDPYCILSSRCFMIQ